jgi:hypothetical protein
MNLVLLDATLMSRRPSLAGLGAHLIAPAGAAIGGRWSGTSCALRASSGTTMPPRNATARAGGPMAALPPSITAVSDGSKAQAQNEDASIDDPHRMALCLRRAAAQRGSGPFGPRGMGKTDRAKPRRPH